MFVAWRLVNERITFRHRGCKFGTAAEAQCITSRVLIIFVKLRPHFDTVQTVRTTSFSMWSIEPRAAAPE
jgi:hypothetical protein